MRRYSFFPQEQKTSHPKGLCIEGAFKCPVITAAGLAMQPFPIDSCRAVNQCTCAQCPLSFCVDILHLANQAAGQAKKT